MLDHLPKSASITAHNSAVDIISKRVADFYSTKTQFRIYHGSTNATRPSLRQMDRMVDTSRLNHVLHVDKGKMVALVEPNVPMDDLVDATLKEGGWLVPPVVMEFPGSSPSRTRVRPKYFNIKLTSIHRHHSRRRICRNRW